MAKIATIFLFIVFWYKQSSAQQSTINFGEIYSNNEFMPYKIIGENKTDFIVVCKPRNIRYYDNYVSNILKDVIGYAEYSIALVDKSKLSISKMSALPKFKAELITKKAFPFIHGMFLSGDTLNVLTSIKDKVQKDYAMHVWHLDSKSLEPLTSEAKLITRIPDSGKDTFKKIQVKKFDKSHEIAITYSVTNNKVKVLNVCRLNSEFTLIKKDSIVYEDNQHWLGVNHIEADSLGNIFILSTFSEVSSHDWDDSRWLGLQMIPITGERISTTNIKTKGGSAFSGKICLNSTGEVFVCGYYSSYIESKDREKEVLGGSFIAKISALSGELLTLDEKELTNNQKKALYPSNLNPNSISSIYGTINNLKVKKLDIDPQGNIMMVGVVASTSTAVITRGNSQYTTAYYESNSVFISKFNAAGNVVWQTIVPKNSSISDFDGMLDPLICFNKGATTLLFNDHSKNIEIMNHLAAGTNVDSNSSPSSVELAEPLDLSPSDSDEILTIKDWQQDHTILRKTVIDSSGKWKVSWINLEASKEYKKNAILEGSLMYSDLEGNIISCIYSKYGVLNKAQDISIVKIIN